ncbi:flagellar transcriptional regulator FlhC [Paraburkholderia sp. B3]|uniref:flagellar transcriptional regulator FlhC n=1 Tax=Paraburkholderia sp. B3 TaxID=3134791 RepID=UPI003982A064
MYKGSVTEDAREVLRAIELIQLGARMPVLEKELRLSRTRMIRLYRELKGASPPKGMLPFSADWYFTWLPNVHASLFYNIYLFLRDVARCTRLDALTRAYRLYIEHCYCTGIERVLSFTRAWTLLRFFEGGLLTLAFCPVCSGRFVRHVHETNKPSVCCVCAPPSRAATTRLAQAAMREAGDDERRTPVSFEMPPRAGSLYGDVPEEMMVMLDEVSRTINSRHALARTTHIARAALSEPV